MLNDDIISQLVHMVLEGENSEVQSSGAETLSKFAQYGQPKLVGSHSAFLISV